eukprot:609106-Amphidinium_carterae.1
MMKAFLMVWNLGCCLHQGVWNNTEIKRFLLLPVAFNGFLGKEFLCIRLVLQTLARKLPLLEGRFECHMLLLAVEGLAMHKPCAQKAKWAALASSTWSKCLRLDTSK